MKAVLFCTFGLLIQFGVASKAMAIIPMCQDLFRDSVATESRGKQFRLSLLNNINSFVADARTEKHKAIHHYRETLRQREDVSKKSIEKSIATSETLRALHLDASEALPPSLQYQTWKAMNDSSLSTSEIARILSGEPYFVWLKHNSLVATVTPIEIYLEFRKSGLEPEMAFIRLQKETEPSLSTDAVKWADLALHHDANLRVLKTHVIELIETASAIPGGPKAWSLMPTLNVGRENFRSQLDLQVSHYGMYFSRSTYELGLSLLDTNHLALQAIGDLRGAQARGMNQEQILKILSNSLSYLRGAVRGSRDVSLIQTAEFIDLALAMGAGGSYEAALARYFDPVAAETISALGRLIEIAEAFQTKESGLAYIQDLVIREGVRP